jgi:hypothetical protein
LVSDVATCRQERPPCRSAFIATALPQDDARPHELNGCLGLSRQRPSWAPALGAAALPRPAGLATSYVPILSKMAAFLVEAEADVLAFMIFPAQHPPSCTALTPSSSPSCVSWEPSPLSKTMNERSHAHAA